MTLVTFDSLIQPRSSLSFGEAVVSERTERGVVVVELVGAVDVPVAVDCV